MNVSLTNIFNPSVFSTLVKNLTNTASKKPSPTNPKPIDDNVIPN